MDAPSHHMGNTCWIHVHLSEGESSNKDVAYLIPLRLSFFLQEWHHVVVCLFLGAAALTFPLYELHDIPDGPFASL